MWVNTFHDSGFIDFIVEPIMVVMGDMLMKMIEPLVQMPADEGGDEGEKEGADSNAASPVLPQ